MAASGAEKHARRIILAIGIALATACGLSIQGESTSPVPAVDTGTPDAGPDVHPNLFNDGSNNIIDSSTGPQCPGTAGPTPILVTYDGGAFCIDSTEVTRADYAAFLALGADAAAVIAGCEAGDGGLDASLEPADAGDASAFGTYFPVFGVTYCDANMYCAWAGKRLCGALGGGGNHVVIEAGRADLLNDEWGYACSNAGTTHYPYANDAGPECDDTPPGSMHEAGSLPACVGGVSTQLFDMSKNVFEWEHACGGTDDAPQDMCFFRGGDSNSSPMESSCDLSADAAAPRTAPPTMMTHVGFRCCGTPTP